MRDARAYHAAQAAEERRRTRAEIVRLRAIVEPLAALADEYDGLPDGTMVCESVRLTVGCLRRARAALGER